MTCLLCMQVIEHHGTCSLARLFLVQFWMYLLEDKTDGERFSSSLRFFIDTDHSPLLLPVQAPKAPLKMESNSYPKSPPGYEICFRNREHILPIWSPCPKTHKNGKCSISVIFFGPFFASWNFHFLSLSNWLFAI